MKYENGTRVRVIGELSDWTTTAQGNLPGARGTIVGYKPDFDGRYPAHLVEFDIPVQVNPINSFKRAWINVDNLVAEYDG